jgi:hypothetical protein
MDHPVNTGLNELRRAIPGGVLILRSGISKEQNKVA